MPVFARRRLFARLASLGLGGGWLRQAGAAGATAPVTGSAADDPVRPGRPLAFPRDHGAHTGSAIEWWYATGWLASLDAAPNAPAMGFQVTFFRSRTPLASVPASASSGRFAARQLLFAHAAITDLGQRRHHHAQRVARWSGEDDAAPEGRHASHAAHAALDDTRLHLGAWQMQRHDAAGPASRYACRIAAPEAAFTLDLSLQTTQPLLLQGDAGFSRKGPLPVNASHYYSQPQLRVQAELRLHGRRQSLRGTGWLDHEWSDALLAPEAVGWDWIGINLFDGGALTAFVLRRADGSVLWGGGSHRPAGGPLRVFGPQELRFMPRRQWTSPASGARYPVGWQLSCPAGSFGIEALLDAQELDSRASTGAIYWEGLAELTDAAGTRRGLGYLEMTGRAGALRLNG